MIDHTLTGRESNPINPYPYSTYLKKWLFFRIRHWDIREKATSVKISYRCLKDQGVVRKNTE
jgi:hypothetical protein